MSEASSSTGTDAAVAMELPLEVLEQSLDRPLTLVLQSGRRFSGTLTAYDDFVNVILDNTTLVAARQVALIVVEP